MLKNPGEYFVIVGKLWGKEISGPLLGALGIASAIAAPFFANSPGAASALLKGAAVLFGAAAVWSVFAAQYRAWRSERQMYEEQCAVTDAERAKNAKAEIRAEALGFVTTRFQTDIRGARGQFQIVIRAVNHRPVTVSVREIRIDGGALPIPAIFENPEVWRPQRPGNPTPHSNSPEFVYGIEVDLAASATVIVEGYTWKQLGETLDLTGLKIELVDALGGCHEVSVEAGSRITY